VTIPEPGMKWAIAMRPAANQKAKPDVVEGMKGAKYRVDGVRHSNGRTETWFTIGGRVFTIEKASGAVVELPLLDSKPNAASSLHVSGFPGVHWASNTTLSSVAMDEKSKKWIAVHKQGAKPLKQLGEGEEAIFLTDGPTVAVEATFDAKTGLPLYAKVGDKLYTYQISLTGGTDPELPPALRAGIMKKLQREAALAEAIRKQEGGQR
jgi:hypothetical protein